MKKTSKNQKNISILTQISLILIRVYQNTFSGLIGRSCRFAPSCSDYALIALKKHGFLKGWKLAIIRILKCNPWGPHGYDEVPEVTIKKSKEKSCD